MKDTQPIPTPTPARKTHNDTQLGRLMWKAVGDAGWAARINHCLALAARFEAALRDDAKWRGAFRLVTPASCANVCFWWVPPALRPLDVEAATAAQLAALGRAAPAIKARMQVRCACCAALSARVVVCARLRLQRLLLAFAATLPPQKHTQNTNNDCALLKTTTTTPSPTTTPSSKQQRSSH